MKLTPLQNLMSRSGDLKYVCGLAIEVCNWGSSCQLAEIVRKFSQEIMSPMLITYYS
jgi:hypothetical protein